REAVDLMRERRIGAILVTKADGLVGIFTERDLLNRVVGEKLDPDTTKLSEVMTNNPDRIGPNDRCRTALDLMQSKGYRHLPVVDGEKVVAVLSVRDLFNAVRQDLEHEVKEQQAFIYDTAI
ncbi:MAG: CBS domain-containing protein, partial [Alphaproteobacteria bacterium]|nr:CBS domain-containing protein [Alphaproteobacteria bacterium]